jgi:hypothetical protein
MNRPKAKTAPSALTYHRNAFTVGIERRLNAHFIGCSYSQNPPRIPRRLFLFVGLGWDSVLPDQEAKDGMICRLSKFTRSTGQLMWSIY